MALPPGADIHHAGIELTALTVAGRDFDSRASPGMSEMFLESECVSCGACAQACPAATQDVTPGGPMGVP